MANNGAQFHLTRNIKHGILRHVVLLREAQSIGLRVSAQAFGISQNIASKRGIAINQLFEFIKNQFGGTVAVTVDFIDDDFHFLVDFSLGVCAVENNVGEHIDSARKVFAQHSG